MGTINIDFDAAYNELFGDSSNNSGSVDEMPTQYSDKKIDVESANNEKFGDSSNEEENLGEEAKKQDNKSVVVGLDIGATKVVCVIGYKNANGKIVVIGSSQIALNEEEQEVGYSVEAVKSAIKQASQEAGVEITHVSVGFSNKRIKSIRHRGVLMRDHHDTEISEAELERLRNDTFKINMTPGEEIIYVIRQDTYVDGELATNPVGMLGNKIEANFHVIIGQTSAAKNIMKPLQSAGVKIDFIIPDPIASANSVLDKNEMEVGVVLVNIGGNTTDIVVYKDKKVKHVAAVPLGGCIITKDICASCKIIKRYAEEVKVNFGSALASENSEDEVVSIPSVGKLGPREISFKNLSHIIQSREEEIIDLIYSEITKTGLEEQLYAGIVLTGGGAMMKHLKQLVEFKTGMDVRIGYPDEHIVLNGDDGICNPSMATCVGVIVDTIERGE